MMKQLFCCIISMLLAAGIAAQQANLDSLKNEISISKNDTTSLILFGKLADVYSEINPDSAYNFAGKMLTITRKLGLKLDPQRCSPGPVSFPAGPPSCRRARRTACGAPRIWDPP